MWWRLNSRKQGFHMIVQHTLLLFNIAMEHGPFIDDFPMNTTIYRGFSMAMLNNQMVQLGFTDDQWVELRENK